MICTPTRQVEVVTIFSQNSATPSRRHGWSSTKREVQSKSTRAWVLAHVIKFVL